MHEASSRSRSVNRFRSRDTQASADVGSGCVETFDYLKVTRVERVELGIAGESHCSDDGVGYR